MKACFADSAELPISCAHDICEMYNCQLAMHGEQRDTCKHWQPQRTVLLALDILGVDISLARNPEM